MKKSKHKWFGPAHTGDDDGPKLVLFVLFTPTSREGWVAIVLHAVVFIGAAAVPDLQLPVRVGIIFLATLVLAIIVAKTYGG